MSVNVTLARPYAKALFEHAQCNALLEQWSFYLCKLADLFANDNLICFINNPASSKIQQSALVYQLVQDTTLDHAYDNPAYQELNCLTELLNLLAKNGRLLILPEIFILFRAMRSDYEQTQVVNVIAYADLSSTQKMQLEVSLSSRLNRQIVLNISIDKSLLGGAVIYAGDLVIDGSVRHKLNKLKNDLVV